MSVAESIADRCPRTRSRGSARSSASATTSTLVDLRADVPARPATRQRAPTSGSRYLRKASHQVRGVSAATRTCGSSSKRQSRPPGAQARAHLLIETMERRPDIGLDSYDRFKTHCHMGGGSLIALPLQNQHGTAIERAICWRSQGQDRRGRMFRVHGGIIRRRSEPWPASRASEADERCMPQIDINPEANGVRTPVQRSVTGIQASFGGLADANSRTSPRGPFFR
jgi:hypothetical protein